MERSLMGRLLVAGLLVVVAGTGRVNADQPGDPAPGQRVRITAPAFSGQRLIGRVVQLDATTVTLEPQDGKEALAVPRRAITRIEVSQHRGRRGKGAGIGALVGIGAAMAIGLGAGEDCGPDSWLCFDRKTVAAMSAILTVPVGALVGLAAAPGERWVTTTDRVRVAVIPARGGLRAAVSVRF